MVHIITINRLGRLTTSFFGEGYANALDGNYGSQLIDNKIIWRRNDSTLVKLKKVGKLVSPSELLCNKKIPVREYYPQIGCLIDWLFKTYGVEQINKLYSLKSDKIEKEFRKVTGEEFSQMEKQYMEHCQRIK